MQVAGQCLMSFRLGRSGVISGSLFFLQIALHDLLRAVPELNSDKCYIQMNMTP